MADNTKLDEQQSKALLDILSHHGVYAEIQDFRYPGSLDAYGPPFYTDKAKPSTTPSLQALVNTFLTTLPGLRNVSPEFYNNHVKSVIDDFEKAELSESYDKGNLGIRKTLATALAALLEYVVRGIYAGFHRPDADLDGKVYDTKDANDLQRAFRDAMQRAVYGSLIDDIFAKTAQTDKLAEHTALVQAAHEYGLVNFASFLHFALVKSPKGQQLLGLIENANKLVPYTIVRQTLKIGNVATMLNAMIKVVLAKMSVTSVTNWIGLTQGQDEGMNLMQNIITQVLNWDIRDFKSRAAKIEKSKDGPSKMQLNALKNYMSKTREDHEKLRRQSRTKSQSIAFVIFEDAGVSTDTTGPAHQQALDYLSIQLSIRDRQEIIRVMCHGVPDHLTQMIRDMVAAYEPLIRSVHNSVDLSDTVYDFEVFLRDLIKLSKVPDPSSKSARRTSTQQPTVGDFVALLRKHQYSSHKFLHQVAKNGPDITQWFREYANKAAKQFQQSSQDTPNPGAGDLTPGLQALFDALPAAQQKEILPILAHHAKYVQKLHDASAVRLRNVVTSKPSDNPVIATPLSSQDTSRAGSRATSPTRPAAAVSALKSPGEHVDPGPGAYLARWQALLDATAMTPTVATGGRVRGVGTARDAPAATAEEGGVPGTREDEESGEEDDDFRDAYERLDQFALDDEDKVSRPDVRPVVEALGKQFRGLLAERGCTW